MIRLLLLLALLLFPAAAADQEVPVQTEENLTLTPEYFQALKEVEDRLVRLNKDLDENIWVKRYQDHREYRSLKEREMELEEEIKDLRRQRGAQAQKRMEELKGKQETLASQVALLGEFGENPYETLTRIVEPPETPEVNNPFAIFSALSFMKEMSQAKLPYRAKLKSLGGVIELLREKRDTLQQRHALLELQNEPEKTAEAEKRLRETERMIEELHPIFEIFSTNFVVYNKKLDEINLELKNRINSQISKLIDIGIIIGILILLMALLKFILKRTMGDSEMIFTANRAVNIVGFVIVAVVLLFFYIHNITYLITVLGFVSAGIAIAMKDWFMSMLGWMVIVGGGYVHVGDRIRVMKDGEEFLGDVLEISLTRITLLEDVTLPTYEKNRRAGRIVFIPNNYIFTTMYQNYTFGGMKTVWDGVDIMVTFDSNHKKAAHIARQITKKYAKGYTDITRRQLNALRSKYNLRTANVEPRIFTFIERYGIKISSWYLTNSYATLTLRSTISAEIVDAFRQEEDIHIAYPTYTLKGEGGDHHVMFRQGVLPFEEEEGTGGEDVRPVG